MKILNKFVATIIIVVLMGINGCQKEEKINLDELSEKIVKSENSTRLLNSSISFYQSLRIQENKIESLIDDELRLDEWVINNIKQTDFTSYEHYISEKQAYNTSLVNFQNEFRDDFLFINENGLMDDFKSNLEKQTIDCHLINSNDPENLTKSCTSVYNSCTSAAESVYFIDMAIGVATYAYNPVLGTMMIIGAITTYNSSMNACHEAALLCAGIVSPLP